MHAYFGDKGGAGRLKKLLAEGAKHSALKKKTGVYKIVSCPKCGNTKDNHMPNCPANK